MYRQRLERRIRIHNATDIFNQVVDWYLPVGRAKDHIGQTVGTQKRECRTTSIILSCYLVGRSSFDVKHFFIARCIAVRKNNATGVH